VQNNGIYHKITWNLKGRLFALDRPGVMGILNLTPDSFYSGSRTQGEKELIQRATQMVRDGVDVLDVGGYSTRPQAAEISASEERQRVVPAIARLAQEFPEVPLSVDTFRATIAREAVEAGASIVNDVTGGEMDAGMASMVAGLGVPYVLTHYRGTPATMTSLTQYDNLIKDITDYFHRKVQHLRSLGIKDIVLDPGFGFAKTVDQNFSILNQLSWFRTFDLPILVGLSRKSMIWRTLLITADQAGNGTTALHMVALQNGASMLRAHDVAEARQCITLFQKLHQPL
jgi:dihydropteroate synthase